MEFEERWLATDPVWGDDDFALSLECLLLYRIEHYTTAKKNSVPAVMLGFEGACRALPAYPPEAYKVLAPSTEWTTRPELNTPYDSNGDLILPPFLYV